MASADSSVSWAQAFLRGTSRGHELLDELAELERRLAQASPDCAGEGYRRVADCWLRIVEEASAYAALSTARHYTSVLKRFQTDMCAVLDELGRGLDALTPLLHAGSADVSPAAARRGRHHLRLIDCGTAGGTPASAPCDFPDDSSSGLCADNSAGDSPEPGDDCD